MFFSLSLCSDFFICVKHWKENLEKGHTKKTMVKEDLFLKLAFKNKVNEK